MPENFTGYESNKILKAACERYFEKIVESATDLAFMVIAKNKFRIPEDDIDSFKILKENGIISDRLYKSLKEAKGMRNFIVHQYGRINDKLVFESITENLAKDIRELISRIMKIFP